MCAPHIAGNELADSAATEAKRHPSQKFLTWDPRDTMNIINNYLSSAEQ